MLRFPATSLTRRRALQVLGAGAAASTIPEWLLAQQAASAPLTFPKGAIIRTLFKDYTPEELAGGATLFHEHLQMGTDFNARFSAATAAARAANGLPPQAGPGGGGGGAKGAPKGDGKAGPAAPKGPPPDINHNVDLMVEELLKVKANGIACLVDAGHPEMGRDLNFVRQVSMKSGLPVVAGGGFYSQPFYPESINTMTEDQLFKALIKQVDDDTVGVFGEIGSWDEITATERKVFRAVGRAHVATNMSIFTHTGIPGKSAIEQLDILEDAGVKPDRVVIGHLGNLVDPAVTVHKILCRRGAFIGFDRQGGNDTQQVPMVKALVDAGFADHLMFSADGSNNYSKTVTVFLPKLRAAGIPDDVLHKIMYDNPRRFLAFVPKRPRKK